MADSTTARVVAPGWRFQLRELLLLIFLIAVALAWWRDHQQQSKRQELYERQIGQLQERQGASVSATEDVLAHYKQELQHYQLELDRYQLERLAWTSRSFLATSAPPPTPEEFLTIVRGGNESAFHRYIQPFAASSRANEAIPGLIKLLGSPNPVVRCQSLQSLGKVRGSPESTVPAIVPLLNDPESAVCRAAAYALGAFGPDAQDAIPPLTAVMNNDQSPLAVTAAIMLNQIDPRMAIGPRLIELLRNPNVIIRASAIVHLEKHVDPEEIERVLPQMYAREENELVRRAIARTLNETGQWKSK